MFVTELLFCTYPLLQFTIKSKNEFVVETSIECCCVKNKVVKFYSPQKNVIPCFPIVLGFNI